MNSVISAKDERCMHVYIGWETKFCVQVEIFFFILQNEVRMKQY